MNKKTGLYILGALVLALLVVAAGTTGYKNYNASKQDRLEQRKEAARNAAAAQEAEKENEESLAAAHSDEIDGMKEQTAEANAPVDAKDVKKDADGATDLKQSATEVSGSLNKDIPKNATEVSKPENAVSLNTMQVPLIGGLIADFTGTELAYSKTLDMWTTHDGVDIKGDEGAEVKAAMDGTVVSVKEDPTWGMTIVIDHGSNITTTYSNLGTLEMVSVGQKVKKGDVISEVGKTALAEIAEEPHLHFVLKKDGKPIDVKPYVPKQAFANN